MNPSRTRQPVFNIPAVLVVLLGLMIAVQALQETLPDRLDANLLARFAFVPGRLTFAWDPAQVADQVTALEADGAAGVRQAQEGRFFLGNGSLQPWTVLTYALLHGNWMHLGLNGIWLLAFGAPVARRFGVTRFLLFFAASAVVGAATHYAIYPVDLQPLVGASAAVSGCMGAALRFMFAQPVGPPAGVPVYRRPRVPIRAMLADRRAVAFLVVWFVTNVVTGLGAVAWGVSEAPIAWQAHIGGFLFGLFGFPLLDPEPRVEAQPPAPGTPE